MSGSLDDFVSIQPGRGSIEVAGGIKLPIQGVGTIRLRCKLPNGSTQPSELTKVLYSEELRGTRLFSWTYVRKQGYQLTAIADDLLS
jgi:hypothetical protein